VLLFAVFAHATDYKPWWAELQAPAGWEEVGRKNVDGVGEVVIRHKKIQGQDCLEGSTSAAVDADALLAAASDIPAQPGWSTWQVRDSVKLSSGATSFDYYQVLDNPFPVNDRYWFVRASITRKGEERVFAWEALDPATYGDTRAKVVSAYPDAVETRINVGDWTFTPQAGSTRIRYRICTDVGGNIPSWAGEFAARTTLPTNLADIVKEVKRKMGLK
jgi:hypothetical protein